MREGTQYLLSAERMGQMTVRVLKVSSVCTGVNRGDVLEKLEMGSEYLERGGR